MWDETRYASYADVAIAYRTFGEGPRDLVYAGNFFSSTEVAPERSFFRIGMENLEKLGRVIIYDQPGTGASDYIPTMPSASLELWTDALAAVMDSAGSREAVLIAQDAGFFTAAMFAATYPSRTSALISMGGWPRVLRDDDFPWGYPEEAWDSAVEATSKMWGTGEWQHIINPEMPWSEEVRREWAKAERAANSPSAFRQANQLIARLDVRNILPTIRVPTLVLQHSQDRLVRSDIGRYVAARIPGAKFVEIPGRNHYLFIEPGARRAFEEINEFLTGTRITAQDEDRVLATVLFTDIVDSTRRAAELGDRDWRALLDAHDAVVRSQLTRFRGREVKTIGDGFLATFDGPQRAIKSALAIRDAVQPLGIELRAGLHTGECEVRGDDVGGIAVHIGARVAALAGPGEILVSGTLRDLVVGSGLEFEDRGAHELKGVPGEWKLFAVAG
jgi:class 3 adenylate cyclase